MGESRIRFTIESVSQEQGYLLRGGIRRELAQKSTHTNPARAGHTGVVWWVMLVNKQRITTYRRKEVFTIQYN